MRSELETADVNLGRSHKLRLEPKLRDDVLKGALAHWVALRNG
jgi:hypothetical protein